MSKTSDTNLGLNLILSLLNSAMNLLFPVVTFPYAARILGPNNIGTVGMLLNLYGYFALLTGAITIYGTREIARCGNKASTIQERVSQIFTFHLTSNIFLGIVWLTICLFVPRLYNLFNLSALLVIPIVLAPFSVDWYFNGQERFIFVVLRNLFCKLFCAAVLYVLVKRSDDVLGYLMVSTLSIILPTIPNFPVMIKETRIKLRFHWPRQMLSSLWKILATSGIGSTYQFTDVILLGFISGDLAVGLYLAAKKLLAVASGVCSAISYVFLPRLSSLAEACEVKFQSTFSLGLSLFFFLTFPLMIYFIVFADGAIAIVAGSKFIQSASTLRILALSLVPTSIATLLGFQYFMAKQRESAIVKANLLGAATNLTLNIILVPKISYNGPAVALIVSETIVAGSLISQSNGILSRVDIGSQMRTYLSAAALAGLFAWFANGFFGGITLFIVQTTIFAISYLVILHLQNERFTQIFALKIKEGCVARLF
jgi:O-antigen/teichoic acid export membrane protein